MQTSDLTALAPATLALLAKLTEKSAGDQRDELAAGKYTVDEIVTLKISGKLSVSADGDKAPTSSIPLLPALALMTKRMGIQRESALEVLREVMTEALSLGKDATEELLRETGVQGALDDLRKKVIAELPRTPVKGKVVAEGTVLAASIGMPAAE